MSAYMPNILFGCLRVSQPVYKLHSESLLASLCCQVFPLGLPQGRVLWQIKAILCAALWPNFAVIDDSPGKLAKPEWHEAGSSVSLHPSSVNSVHNAQQFSRPYLVYLEKVQPEASASARRMPCQKARLHFTCHLVQQEMDGMSLFD